MGALASPIRALDLLGQQGAHLGGVPCGHPVCELMDPVIELADGTRQPVTEDCALALLDSGRFRVVSGDRLGKWTRFRLRSEVRFMDSPSPDRERLPGVVRNARGRKVLNPHLKGKWPREVPEDHLTIRQLLARADRMNVRVTYCRVLNALDRGRITEGTRVQLGVGQSARTIRLDKRTLVYIAERWGVDLGETEAVAL
ncbi:MAG: hypothetical protein Rubg2KO_15450 [Rubricoccaceae bacterium]